MILQVPIEHCVLISFTCPLIQAGICLIRKGTPPKPNHDIRCHIQMCVHSLPLQTVCLVTLHARGKHKFRFCGCDLKTRKLQQLQPNTENSDGSLKEHKLRKTSMISKSLYLALQKNK
uniref:Uncharacterized protein n=1 Tax=Anguilla anguilla TaxID=7936 RepID=A0A0E9WAZ9_ANGAN